jgi:hypothetical protein
VEFVRLLDSVPQTVGFTLWHANLAYKAVPKAKSKQLARASVVNDRLQLLFPERELLSGP